MDNITQIAITIVTVAGSAGIWKFMETKIRVKAEQRKADTKNNDGIQYRDDLKDRVRNLEALLAKSFDKEDQLNSMVLELTGEVQALRVKVEFLEKENERLKNTR